jgi:release factor glutamine methyltransferase
MSGNSSIKIFQTLEARLNAAGNGNAKRSVEELAAHVLGCKPLEIYFREVTSAQQAELEALIARAEQGEPIQYMIGHVDFRGLEIHCDRRALIPRPETELLVEEVLQSQVSSLKPFHIVDVCTGTGCIGLALAHELPNAEVTAVDISPEALALARENAERLGLSDRITFVQGNLLHVDAVSPPRSKQEKRSGDTASTLFAERSLDIVVSNPPYIFSKVWKNLEPCVCDFEPQLALDGGEDGMDLIRPLIKQAARVLKPGGGLFIETGYDQGSTVFQCLENAGFQNVRIVKDLAGLDRIVAGLKVQN